MAMPLHPFNGMKESKEVSKKELPNNKQAIQQQRTFASDKASKQRTLSHSLLMESTLIDSLSVGSSIAEDAVEASDKPSAVDGKEDSMSLLTLPVV
jgi:hypothetical protein